jgi:hypothetical protein
MKRDFSVFGCGRAAIPFAAVVFVCFAAAAAPARAGFEAAARDGRIEVSDGGKVVLAWQRESMTKPGIDKKFAGSAFLAPLRTPGGFVLTDLQPSDHRHHFGVWWPWKYLEVDGRKYNCWEVQEHQGRHVAVDAKVEKSTGDEVVLALANRHEVFAGGKFVPVLRERTRVRIGRMGKDAYVIDIDIKQDPEPGRKVKVLSYRYSGFSWRGTPKWNAKNSRMITSAGLDREQTNHKPARWAMVGGPTPSGAATMLIMSAAAKNGGEPELLRVWGKAIGGGKPFVDFNPVVRESMPLDGSHPEVSHRRYRLILADRKIQPAEAERLWNGWKPQALAD